MLNEKEFPDRNLILFITYVVIIVTLVGQGLAIPWIVRKVKPQSFPVNKTEDQQLLEIELQLNKAAVDELKNKYNDDMQKNALIKHKFEFLENKVKLLYESNKGDGARRQAKNMIEHFQKVMMNVSEKERKELHLFRRNDDFDDDIIRTIENRLDLEEERLVEDSE